MADSYLTDRRPGKLLYMGTSSSEELRRKGMVMSLWSSMARSIEAGIRMRSGGNIAALRLAAQSTMLNSPVVTAR